MPFGNTVSCRTLSGDTQECRRRDSNSHEGYPSEDFKSSASAIPPRRQLSFVENNGRSLQSGMNSQRDLRLQTFKVRYRSSHLVSNLNKETRTIRVHLTRNDHSRERVFCEDLFV